MSERKTYCTRLNEFEAETVDKIAAEVWPEHADNVSELLRAIITDWRRTRDAGGKSNKILHEIRELKLFLEEIYHVHRQSDREA